MKNTDVFDLSGIRCFADADGCLFDSLRHCNDVLDDMFKGVLTDKSYPEYYQAFGDAYEIIPGSPWKGILEHLVEYLVNQNAAEFGVAIGSDEHRKMLFSGYEAVSGVSGSLEEMSEALVRRFERLIVKRFHEIDEDIEIKPVADFCRKLKAAGGELVIHSGTNEAILKAMLDVSGLGELVDGYLCSDMMDDADPGKLGKWGYKTELLSRLLDGQGDSHGKDFVLGDSKGDGFGAGEVGVPFVLTWRGYPKDPSVLSGGAGEEIVPALCVDVRPEVMDKHDAEHDAAVTTALLEYAAGL